VCCALDSVDSRRVAYFTTAPEDAHELLAEHLRAEYDADVVGVSGNLARRDALREDIDRLEAEVYVVEIKAAAIDVVAEEAERRGVELVFADNDVLPLPGEADLDRELRRLVA
jgi:cyclic 2,3-diphosphoglycerate synthetase